MHVKQQQVGTPLLSPCDEQIVGGVEAGGGRGWRGGGGEGGGILFRPTPAYVLQVGISRGRRTRKKGKKSSSRTNVRSTRLNKSINDIEKCMMIMNSESHACCMTREDHMMSSHLSYVREGYPRMKVGKGVAKRAFSFFDDRSSRNVLWAKPADRQQHATTKR